MMISFMWSHDLFGGVLEGFSGMSILAFSRLLGSPVEDIISWLQTKKLLAASKVCPACQAAMVLSLRSDRSDGHRYVNLY